MAQGIKAVLTMEKLERALVRIVRRRQKICLKKLCFELKVNPRPLRQELERQVTLRLFLNDVVAEWNNAIEQRQCIAIMRDLMQQGCSVSTRPGVLARTRHVSEESCKKLFEEHPVLLNSIRHHNKEAKRAREARSWWGGCT